MKSFAILFSLVLLTVATPLSYDNAQVHLSADEPTYPGYSLDLTAKRLVQFDGEEPVWMTEYDKVGGNLDILSNCF